MLMWIDRAAAMGVGSAAIDSGIMISNFKNELRWNEMVVLLGRRTQMDRKRNGVKRQDGAGY